MSVTVRQYIVDNIKSQISTLNAASGLSTYYNTIEDWRLFPLDDADLPSIIVMDNDAKVSSHNDVVTDYDMEVSIALYAKKSGTAGNVRDMLADIYKAINVDRTLGGYAEDIIPDSENISMQQKDNVYGDAEIKFLVKFATGAYNPAKNYS